jgi:hypothetical protein
MNRKGSLQDIVGMMLIFTVMVIVSFLALYIQTETKNAIIATAPYQSTNSTYILNQGTASLGVFINSIPFITIGILIAAIISAFFIPSHPVFVPLSIILLALYTVLAAVFSNIIWEFLNTPGIITLANSYPLVVSIVVKQPYIVTIFGALLIIVMHSKSD